MRQTRQSLYRLFLAAEYPEDRTAASRKRSSDRARLQHLTLDLTQEGVAGKNHALEVISGFVFPTTGNRLRTETPNATGFIGDRQPGIGVRRGYGDPRMHHEQ